MYYILGLGFLGALESTPTRLLFSKGLRRVARLNLKRLDPLEDFSGNSVWLGAFCLVVSVYYFTLMYIVQIPFQVQIFCLAILFLQMIFFASGLEYFRLSVYGNRQSLFWTALALLWIGIPILGSILGHNASAGQYLSVQSPFWAPAYSIDFTKGNLKCNTGAIDVSYALALNALLALLMIVLAAKERRRIRKEILV